MANGYYGDRAGVLPNMFGSPGQSLQNLIQYKQGQAERQYEIDYRNRKEQEAEDWRKLNLINDLTDLSKHQTGSDVADAIGAHKMNDIYQYYTQAAATMSPAELQARIQKDMSGIISGMDATKQELNLADEQLKVLKQKFPSVDIGTLGSDYRKEILSRRLNNNTDFVNPLQVGQSQFNVLDPDFLSKYVIGNKNLSESIINPKGVETMKVLRGSPNAYTEYTSKVPFWKKENFNRDTLKDGFYNGKDEPRLDIKAKEVPALSKPNAPFMAIDEDVYKRFSEDEGLNLELTAAARSKFKDYDTFKQEEKELAKRNVLYDKVKELDQSNYYPTDVKSPPRTYNRTTISIPKEGSEKTYVNDIYTNLETAAKEAKDKDVMRGSGKLNGTAILSERPFDEQNIVVDFINKSHPNLKQEDKLGANQILLKYEDNGTVGVYSAETENFLGTLPKVGTNLKVQPSVKEKKEVISEGKKNNTYTIKGKNYTLAQLEKMGYNESQVEPYKNK